MTIPAQRAAKSESAEARFDDRACRMALVHQSASRGEAETVSPPGDEDATQGILKRSSTAQWLFVRVQFCVLLGSTARVISSGAPDNPDSHARRAISAIRASGARAEQTRAG